MAEWFETNKISLIWTGIVILIDVLLLIIIPWLTKRINNKSTNRAKALTYFLANISRLVVIMLSFVIVLTVWGLDTLIGVILISIIFLIIGIGAKGLLNDAFVGIANIFANTFELDEYIEIDGYIGKVINVGITNTKIQLKSGEIKIFRNGFIKSITNLSRTFVTSKVTIKTNNTNQVNDIILALEEGLLSLKEEYPQIFEGPNVNGIESVEDGAVTILISAKTNIQYKDIIERAIRKKSINILNRKKIDL